MIMKKGDTYTTSIGKKKELKVKCFFGDTGIEYDSLREAKENNPKDGIIMIRSECNSLSPLSKCQSPSMSIEDKIKNLYKNAKGEDIINEVTLISARHNRNEQAKKARTIYPQNATIETNRIIVALEYLEKRINQ